MTPLEMEEEAILVTVTALYDRMRRIQARAFAPLRVLRYRLILRKIKKARSSIL